MLDFSVQFTCILDEIDYNDEIIWFRGTVLKGPVTAVHAILYLLNPDYRFVF